jgi:ATP-dependent Lon protease
VLPIGGVREKVLAAQRYGLKRVVVPRENEPDLGELPPEARKELRFILVDSIDEVLAVAFEQPGPRAQSPRRGPSVRPLSPAV